MKLKHFITPIITFILVSCGTTESLQTVASVDLEQYLGTWYEVARLPNSFQKKCNCSKAEYSLREDGKITVLNSCTKEDGTTTIAKAKAWSTSDNNSKLVVQFIPIIKGKYWIIDLAPDYSYAVVGHPNRKYLWILSRTKSITPTLRQQLYTKIEEKGFDLSNIIETKTCE